MVPATVGVLDGKIHVGKFHLHSCKYYGHLSLYLSLCVCVCVCVGMSCDQLTRLAESARLGGVVKVSRRDIAHTLSQVIDDTYSGGALSNQDTF